VGLKTTCYRVGKLFLRLLFGCLARIRVLGGENASRTGGFLLAANHISHFDPFLISLAVRRKIDWMAMAEFYRLPFVGLALRAVDAFPAERDRADRKTIRTAIERLRQGRIVGLFPEGGIRDGARSLLEGAPLRPGASTLAHIARVPIVPCVILGADRFYAVKRWLPGLRTPVWIAFGKPISHPADAEKGEAREQVEAELASAFKELYMELREKFALTADDLPHPPQERAAGRVGTLRRADAPARRPYGVAAKAVDSLICASLNLLHTRHRLNGRGRQEMECYLAACEQLTLQQYYAAPGAADCSSELRTSLARALRNGHAKVAWRSPVNTPFAANNIAHAEFFRCAERAPGPTVFLLHSLMSASRVGHRRCAKRFNDLGWNACFVHLPYHFSRVPRGYWNGELAITCDLVRNAEGLRQGVIELRQLMAALREHACREFGVLATSYGGWIGALVATVESNLRFLALMAPIVNIEHAIWASPAARLIRRELRRSSIDPPLVARHFHLSSPLHCQPACDPARVLFVTGEFDSIAPTDQIQAIQHKWRGSELLHVRQGHFGYRMLRETIARLKQRGDL
jgi:1-acyl-sn-glycerol-3-phosphate acyltransferase